MVRIEDETTRFDSILIWVLRMVGRGEVASVWLIE